MFIGEYSHSLDLKGRLAIPAKFRKRLSSGAVVTRGLDCCLFLYTAEEWLKLAAKLSSLPIARAKSRAFSRLMLAGAMDVRIDRQGRILIPDYLRQYAGLSRQAIVAGLYTRLEIWDAAIWKKYKVKTEKDSIEIAEAMGELGV